MGHSQRRGIQSVEWLERMPRNCNIPCSVLLKTSDYYSSSGNHECLYYTIFAPVPQVDNVIFNCVSESFDFLMGLE